MPTGNCASSRDNNPAGTEIDGTPVRFAGAANISSRYIETGSLFSPILNAALGVVGVEIKETFSNAALNSLLMTVRSVVALL